MGVNHTPSHLAYQAERVDCGEPGGERLTLFAYEWVNPRRGIRVKEIRLKASAGFKNVDGRVSPENPLLLAAVSVVKKRTPPEPHPLVLQWSQ